MHLLCVITNGEFISKTSIKPTYETGTTETEQIGSQTELQALTFSICLFEFEYTRHLLHIPSFMSIG